MTLRLLLLGKDGQVGWELQRALQPLGELTALGRSGSDGYSGDLQDLDGLRNTLQALRPDVVVNAAAYNAVDKAESEPDLALRVNAEAPGILAEEASRQGALLVHYSTDYVFDGTGNRPWSESDEAHPLSAYGRSKKKGEEAIARSSCHHLIFRTSWVYGCHGQNFVKTMVGLGRERDVLNVIEDQVGVPTGAELLADITCHAIRTALVDPSVSGLYHLVPGGETSWYGYARFIFDVAAELGETMQLKSLNPIAAAEFPLPAPRPRNSRLSTEKLTATFGLHLPPWKIGVARMMREWLG